VPHIKGSSRPGTNGNAINGNTANAAAQPAVPISAPNTGGTIPAVNS